MKTEICPVCGEQYTKKHHSQKKCKGCKELKRCEKHEIVHKSTLRCNKCIIDDSRIRYTEDNSYEWVECTLCGYRGGDLFSHINYFHKMSVDEFKIKSGLTSIKSKKIRDGVKGDKNPAYQHGGKYSPFSEKFIYSETTDRKALHEKAEQSRVDNDSHTLKLSHWLKKTNGDVEQAKILLQERLDTLVFSLDKCVEKHGFEKGYDIWKERWQTTLNSKSQEEIDDINRRKSNQFNFRGLWSNTSQLKDTPCVFYILNIGNNKIKIGITTVGIEKRYAMTKNYEIIKEYSSIMSSCFQLEQIIKKKYSSDKILKEDAVEHFGWTESFYNSSLGDIIKTCEDLIFDPLKLTSLFKNSFNLTYGDNF